MMALPQDGMEPLRRMCRWISGETGSVDNTKSLIANQ
jgi:hypothetical protein